MGRGKRLLHSSSTIVNHELRPDRGLCRFVNVVSWFLVEAASGPRQGQIPFRKHDFHMKNAARDCGHTLLPHSLLGNAE